MDAHELHARRILDEIHTGSAATQRTLARRAGIALGLTNLIVRRLVRKGCIRVVRIKPNRVRYMITPAGIAEKARMSRRYLQSIFRFYSEARGRIAESFAELSASWPAGTAEKRIAFVPAADVAEVGYVCLQATDLTLVAVFDDERAKPFFGLPVQRISELATHEPRFDRLIVMSLGDGDDIRARLVALDYPLDRVFWI